MPQAYKYNPDFDSQEARALEDAYKAEYEARDKNIKKNWAYYDGNHKAPLKRDRSGTDDNIIINLIEGIVDKSVSSMIGIDDAGMIKGVEFEIVDEPGEQGFIPRLMTTARGVMGMETERPEQIYMDAVWKANSSSLLLLNALINGAIAGHTFVKVLPFGEYAESGEEVPRLVVLNPCYVSVFWDAVDMSRVMWYRIQYRMSEYEAYRQDIVRDVADSGEDSGDWMIYNYKQEKSSQWQLVSNEKWEYSWPPIVDWQNLPNPNSYYGKPDLVGKTALNDALNLTASNVQRILKNHAHPKTITIGATISDIVPTGVDGIWSIASKEAQVYNLEMQSDLSSSLNFVMLLWRAIFDLSRELNPGTVADKLGAITNFGLRVLFADSLAKGGVKRLLAGEALKRLCRYILQLGNFDVRLPINVVWPEPLPSDPLQTAQALQIMNTLGLSSQTALERAGYDYEQERQRNEERHAQTAGQQTAQNQSALADAVRLMAASRLQSGQQTANAQTPQEPQ